MSGSTEDDGAPPPPKTKARKKPARKPKAAAAEKPARKPKAAKAKSAPRDWGMWLLLEAGAWSVGIGVGLGIAVWVLWERAAKDVADYLAHPPVAVPGVIWSAPEEVHVGERASVAGIAGDLLAAGYDRVDHLPDAAPKGVGVFVASADRIDVWGTPWDGPGKLDVPGGKAWIRLEKGWVVETSAPDGVRLRPTALATIGDADRRRAGVKLSEVSPWMEPALLAMEDSRFRQHHGIDPIGLARATIHNLLSDRGAQGGSTLTQQLAKNLFLSRDRTAQRKIREIFFAAALEHALSKDQLLELYLGEVYLGQFGGLPLHGVEQAARAWFGVSAARLSLPQAALIAGVISAPSVYNPVKDPDAALVRRGLVLDRMVAMGDITAEQAASAKAEPLSLQGTLPGAIRRAPYAVDATVDAAEEVLGDGALAARGWQVYTHVQPVLQRAAEEAVAAGMAELDEKFPKSAGAQVALVALDPRTGGVVAMVGGRDYATSMYNRAVNARRQAGSTVKPLTLLEALDAGKTTPSERLEDQPITRKVKGTTWTPKNYDGAFLGSVTVRQAIEGSRNIPAIHLAEEVGLDALAGDLQEAGLSGATNWPSAALGSFDVTPMELAGAYTAFPDGGVARRPILVDVAVSPDGKEIRDVKSESVRLARAQAAGVAVHVLQGVLTDGTGSRAHEYGVSGAAAGKSGTTDAYRDAWFVGFTPDLVVAVWVGRDQGSLGLSGGKAALPTWARFVAASGTLDGSFVRPPGVEEVAVCAESGLRPRSGCPHVIDEWFVGGTAPSGQCADHGTVASPADPSALPPDEAPADAAADGGDHRILGFLRREEPAAPEPAR